MLGQLAGSMGHELRNPLGVISNAIYFLKMLQTDADDQIKEYLTIIEDEARTSDKIITDLLDFARIKSVDRKAVPASELIHRTLDRFPAPEQVDVTLDIPLGLPLIFADPLIMWFRFLATSPPMPASHFHEPAAFSRYPLPCMKTWLPFPFLIMVQAYRLRI